MGRRLDELPPNVTEAGYGWPEVMAAVEGVVGRLAPSRKFGPYEVDDIKQEGRVKALEALPLYDKGRGPVPRPLENFLYAHVKNRLTNFYRDHCHRNDPPCRDCHEGRRCHDAQRSGEPTCLKYAGWRDRNAAKASLAKTAALGQACEEREAARGNPETVEDEASLRELLGRIDERLPVALRAAYLRMRAGAPVPAARRAEVEAAVRSILTCPPNPAP